MRIVAIVMLGLGSAVCAMAANVSTATGTMEGVLLYQGDDFAILSEKTSGGDAILLRKSEIKELKADAGETEAARARIGGLKLAVFAESDPNTLPPMRTLLKAELQSWYGAGVIANDADVDKIEHAEALVSGILGTRRVDLQKTWTEQLRKLALSNEQLRAVVRDGYVPQFDAGKPGRWIASYANTTFPEQKMLSVVSVPDGYTPDKKWPLIVWLHHTGPGRADYTESYPAEIRSKYIILAPWARSAYGWGPSRLGRASVWSALDWVCSHYRIDANRVYMEGFSMGGVGTRKSAIWMPDRLAAVCARSGPPLKQNIGELYANLHDLPMMALCGSADPLIPAEQFRWEKETLEKLKAPATVLIEEGGSHSEYRERDEEVYPFFEKKTRNAFPNHLSFASFEEGVGLAHYYIEIEPENRDNTPVELNVVSINTGMGSQKHDAEEMKRLGADARNIVDKITTWMKPRSVELTVDRETNTINITKAERVKKIRVFLDSELVDMSKPVTVKLLGREVLKHTPKCSLDFMLNEARRRGRRDVSYWDVIEVPVR